MCEVPAARRGMATVGSRLLDVAVDGIPLAANVDIFKDVGTNAAVGMSVAATATSSRMTVTVTAAVRSPWPRCVHHMPHV